MGLERVKQELTERGSIKNHIFQGVSNAARIICDNARLGDEWLVYFDPDVDGVIAGYLACKFLAEHNRKFSWYINSNRSHGWMLPLNKVRGRNIIAVDFIVTPQQLEDLCCAGCNVVNMDHHINGNKLITAKSSCSEGVVINNQYIDEDEDCRYLSGAGVVFETLIQLDPSFDTLINRQLVAITLLSDIRDIENPLAEGYLYQLYSGKYRGFLKYLIDSTMGDKDYGFGVPRMDRNYVDFKFSPALNSCFRFNRQDDVVRFFFGEGRLSLDWHRQQKALVSKLKEIVKIVQLSHVNVCFFFERDIPGYDDVLGSFVGLLASQCLDGSRSVVGYLISSDKKGNPYVKRASFRGRINGLDYNRAIMEEGLFDCRGHDSAFGIIGLIPEKDTFLKVNKICGNIEKDSNYQRPVISVANMSFFAGKSAYRIAEDNMYKLSQNQTVIKYTGNNIAKRRSSHNYIEYCVDGILVKSFDDKVSFETGLITPVLDRGTITFYLE